MYEPVKVDGRPVSVRLTVPITFALKLPEISRAQGIPELRQEVTPPWPESGGGGGVARADVTLDPDGRIGLARIVEGQEPWSTSLLQALRTWRFRAPPIDTSVSFEVQAEFVPGSGRDKGSVRLRLASLRETALFDDDEPEDVARLEPRDVGTSREASAPAPAAPEPAPAPSQGEAAPEPEEPADVPEPEVPADVPEPSERRSGRGRRRSSGGAFAGS